MVTVTSTVSFTALLWLTGRVLILLPHNKSKRENPYRKSMILQCLITGAYVVGAVSAAVAKIADLHELTGRDNDYLQWAYAAAGLGVLYFAFFEYIQRSTRSVL